MKFDFAGVVLQATEAKERCTVGKELCIGCYKRDVLNGMQGWGNVSVDCFWGHGY
jgi:hypothetical protein